MSKIKCLCGNVISNVSAPSNTDGWISGDVANEHSQEDFRNLVSALLQTVNEVERSKFLTKLFGELYPTDLHDSEVIDDIRDKVFSSRAKSVAECNKCGRIWIQLTAGGQDYASFAPDSGDECLGILKF